MTIIHMQHRFGTTAEWTAANPVLGDGELGFEKDTTKFKIGNGADSWLALDYYGADFKASDLAGGYDVRLSGVIADGTTNCRAAMITALTACAAFGATAIMPIGTVHNAGAAIPVPAGVRIVGHGWRSSKWTGTGFELSVSNEISGLLFDGTGVVAGDSVGAITTRHTTGALDCVVERCRFINWTVTPAITLNAAADNTGATRISIRTNEFETNDHAVLIERGLDCDISGNISKNGVATGRHFVAYSAEGCRWLNNVTFGGITGILLLSFRIVANRQCLVNNIISGNRIYSPSEEGLSLDIAGNAANSVGVVDWGTITAKTYNPDAVQGQLRVTLDAAFTGTPTGQFFAYRLVFTTGAAAGTVILIDADTDSGRTMISNGVRQSVYDALQAGDEFVIGLPIYNNVILGNTVENAGTTSIMIWGFSVGNVVEGNTVRTTTYTNSPGDGGPQAGIEIWGLDGLVQATGITHSGRNGRAPGVNNRIVNNTLDRCNIRFDIQTYSAAPGYVFSPTNQAHGNIFINADGHTLERESIRYAPPPSGGDDQPMLQSLLNGLSSDQGGEVHLQSGTYLLNNPLTIPNKVRVIGTGRSSTTVKAMDTFPGYGHIINLGDSDSLTFAARFERGTIDCNGIYESVGVYSLNAQEMCGLTEVVITGFRSAGVWLDSECANYDFNSVEIYPHADGAPMGFFASGNVGSCVIRRITVGVAGHLVTGIRVQSGTAHLSSIHVENCDDGILFEGADGFVHGVTGPTGAIANVGTVVRVDGNSRYVDLSSITKNNSTHAYKADFFGYTCDENFIEHAVAGDLRVARFYHHGDVFGIFGKSTNQHTDPGAATGTDAAVINNIRTMLHDMGLWN